MEFEGQVSLITGAGRGIGFEYAKELATRGCHVIIHDVGVDSLGEGSDPRIAEEAATAIRELGGSATASSITINQREGCQELIQMIQTDFGRLDSIIHNAGWVGYQSIEELTPEFLDKAVRIQLEAPIWLAQSAWPLFKSQDYGRLVFTTSDRGIYPEYAQAGLTAYATTKISQIGLMNILAEEAKGLNIQINTVSPVAKTRMWGVTGQPEDLLPEAIVPGVVFLSSSAIEESGWVLRAANGQFIATKSVEAVNVTYPTDLRGVTAHSVEEVAQQWPDIAKVVPESRVNS